MRITVIDSVVRDGRGREAHVKALRRQPLYRVLAERGHEVTLVTATRQRTPGVRTERVPPLDGSPDRLDPLAGRLLDLWRRCPPDVVHALEPVPGIAAYAAAARLSVPVVQTAAHPGQAPDSLHDRIWRAVTRRSPGVTVLSSQTGDELVRSGVPRGVLHVVPPGIDTDRFAPDGVADADGAVRRLVHVGSLDVAGGADVAVHALRHIPGVELVIAYRTGPRATAADLDRLRRTTRVLGVADRVGFRQPRSDAALIALLRSADIVVCAPFHEPSDATALQAMACGVPVVATDVGFLRDAVITRATGELVPPGRPDLLARAVRRLAADVTLRRGCALAGVDRIRARYTWSRIAHDVETVYETAVAA